MGRPPLSIAITSKFEKELAMLLSGGVQQVRVVLRALALLHLAKGVSVAAQAARFKTGVTGQNWSSMPVPVVNVMKAHTTGRCWKQRTATRIHVASSRGIVLPNWCHPSVSDN
jgi:hypothetical protein